jgi:hypothetical protein
MELATRFSDQTQFHAACRSDADTSISQQRRKFLSNTCTAISVLFLQPFSSVAAQVRPTSKELLLPPTRVKFFIDKAAAICQSAVQSNDPKRGLVRLQQFLQNEEPSSFMTQEEKKQANQYLEIDTTTPWQRARVRDREERGKESGVDYNTSPSDRFNTAVQHWGDRRQFDMLRDRQVKLEKASPMRMAFNSYTNNLVFTSSYQLNVQGSERSQMIRDNALPDANAVVVSDLDLRDLYRNQILERMEDTRAELEYQLGTDVGDDDVDAKEVLEILQSAQTSCKEWFSFVPAEDAAEAESCKG